MHMKEDMWPFLMSLGHTLTLTCQEKINHAKIKCEFVDIMCEVYTENKKIRTENGVKLLFLQLLKALYVCMDSELL